MDLSIVITVYNGEKNLNKLSEEIVENIKLKYEVIFVNDHSVDNSWKIIKKLVNNNKNFIGLNLRKNLGQDKAVIAGISKANGELLITMDDDLQHSPKDINKLIDKSKEGADVVYANFYKKNKNFIGKFGSYLNGKISQVLLNKPKDIYLSPFRLIKKEIYLEILDFANPYPYVDGMILTITNNISQIIIKHHKRYMGKTNYTFKKSILKFLNHLTGYSIIPLRLIVFFGFINLLFATIFSIYVVFNYMYNDVLNGWSSLFILNMFLGSAIMFSLGIIGEYVGKTYLSINLNKKIIIKEIYKNGSGGGS